MKKSQAITLWMVPAVAALATSCSDPTHRQVCLDPNQVAVEGVRCEQEDKREDEARRSGTGASAAYVPMYRHYYYPYGYGAVPLGQKVSPDIMNHGTFLRLTVTGSGRPATIARPAGSTGGFGSSSSTVGG